MSRYIFSNPNFTCHLNCGQCNGLNKNGQRCRRRVCYGYPTCWQHTLGLFGVSIKNSLIGGGEKGLFAERNFSEGDWICPIIGENITENCFDGRYPDPATIGIPYVEFNFDDNENIEVIDGACSRGTAFVAQALGNNNARTIIRNDNNTGNRDQLWLRATQNIYVGQEIYKNWGEEDERIIDYHDARNRSIDTRPC